MRKPPSGIAVGVAIVSGFAVSIVATQGVEGWHGIRDAIERWITAHDLTLDLVTVWCLAIGFGVLALVKIVSVAALRGSHDQTDVGRSLKVQKAAEAVACVAMATLYGLTLYGYYDGYQFGVWERFGVRLIVAGGVLIASVFGVRFVLALRRETWGRRIPSEHPP